MEYIYPGRDNTIDVILKAENDDGDLVAQELESVNKIRITIGDIVIEGETYNDWPIKWSVLESGPTGKVIMLLGKNDPTPDPGLYDARVDVFSWDHPDGIFWGTFPVTVETPPVEPTE